MPFEVFNIGNGKKITVRELLAKLVSAMDLRPDHPIVELAGSPSDVFGSVAETSHARAELGWEPRTGLDEGLADMVAWARKLAL